MHFQFKPVLTVFTLVGLAILLSLGTWQVQRLAWKNELIATVEARIDQAPVPFAEALMRWQAGEDMEYTPVRASLNFDHQHEAHVFGSLDGDAGWYVFTPSKVRGVENSVYINRGFVSEGLKSRDARPESLVGVDGNEPIEVTGLFRSWRKPPAIAGVLTPPNSLESNQWYLRDPFAFGAADGTETYRAWIDSSGAENTGKWPKGGTTKIEFNNRHLEYALTWFGLAGALVGVFMAFSVRRRPTQAA